MGKASSMQREEEEFWCERQKEKGPIGRPRCKWEENIKMDLREIGRGGMDWTDLAQDRNQ
jgi:hypothetical protein